MRHAGATALGSLSGLLDEIRLRQGLTERKLGIFYRKSKSFLHFHEDALGMFADLNEGSKIDRYPVDSKEQWSALLSAID